MGIEQIRIERGLSQFSQMLTAYVYDSVTCDFRIDDRGRITHKNDTSEGVEKDSFLAKLCMQDEHAMINRDLFETAEFRLSATSFLSNELGGTGRSTIHNSMRDIHKESGIDIPLYKILASLMIRYDYRCMLNRKTFRHTYCDHVSSIDLSKYIGVIPFKQLFRNAALLALPQCFDKKTDQDDSVETLCSHDDYSGYCDTSSFEFLFFRATIRDDNMKMHFKSKEEIEKEIFFPDECSLGYKMRELFCNLLIVAKRSHKIETLFNSDDSTTDLTDLTDVGDVVQKCNVGFLKREDIGLHQFMKELLIEHFDADLGHESEYVLAGGNDIILTRELITDVNRLCFKSSIPLVKGKMTRSSSKNARK